MMHRQPPRRNPRSKYGAVKTTVDGITFDSIAEARRYKTLKLLERAGQISDIQRQVPFELIPSAKDPNTGKCLFRAVVYKADFVYTDKDGQTVVEDVKGFRTPEFVLKEKLMYHRYGIIVREVK